MEFTECEHNDPFDATSPDFWLKIEHLARYLYAEFRLRKSGIKGNVVDIGCGNGYGLDVLAPSCKQVTGVDYDAAALKAAQARNTGEVQLLDMDKTRLSTAFKAQTFHAACAFEVLEHVAQPQAVLDDIFNILKPGGVLLCSIPNPKFERTHDDGTPLNPYHHHLFEQADFAAMLKQAGFEVEPVLGQSLTNRLFSRERNLVRGEVIPAAPFAQPELQTPTMIEAMAHLLAWPFNENVEKSYSFIFTAWKK